MLGDREGDVWLNVGARVVMVDFRDVPVCRVVALSVDPAVLADLVMRVFSEREDAFHPRALPAGRRRRLRGGLFADRELERCCDPDIDNAN